MRTDDTTKNLIESVSNFLKNESEIYGLFKVPEIDLNQGSLNVLSSSQQSCDSTGSVPETTIKPASITESDRSHLQELEQVTTLEELRMLCLNAEVLKTDLDNTNLVFGTGNPAADIILIGEAPGAQEDIEGIPFVGKAGKLLNNILSAISIEREEVYIANILKHRPPNNRDPLPEERNRSLPYLLRQIELINPKFIVCLGRIAAQTLLNTNKPMKALRGTFHPYPGNIDLLVTFHPAALLRNPAWKRDTWEDVKMLRKRFDEQQVQ